MYVREGIPMGHSYSFVQYCNCNVEANDKLSQDFIGKCLIEDPVLRPNVVELMFHKWLFEVYKNK